MFYSYVSTRADYDPAKLFLVCPPAADAADERAAAAFAESSGWQALAEWEGGILLIPLAPNGWQAEDSNLPARLYDSQRNSFSTRNGRSLFARGWEAVVLGNDDLYCWLWGWCCFCRKLRGSAPQSVCGGSSCEWCTG